MIFKVPLKHKHHLLYLYLMYSQQKGIIFHSSLLLDLMPQKLQLFNSLCFHF